MTNVAKKVNDRIKELKDQKAAELNKIMEQVHAYQAERAAAGAELKAAQAQMDVDTYADAKARIDRADTGIEMFQNRYKDLAALEFVNEEESDRVIDSLLDYEDQLAADFTAAIAEPVNKLWELYEAYTGAVGEAERAISQWTAEIHKNYRSFTATYPDGTSRGEAPRPVRMVPYIGCAESVVVKNSLDRLSEYI